MEILDFVRYGMSQDLVDGIRSRPDTPLVDAGRDQAHQAGQAIARQGQQFDLILSSPLPRALKTAEIIAAEIDYDREAINTDPELVERDWGEYAGRSNWWIKEQFAGDPTGFDKVPGAETVEQLQARAARVYGGLLYS